MTNNIKQRHKLIQQVLYIKLSTKMPYSSKPSAINNAMNKVYSFKSICDWNLSKVRINQQVTLYSIPFLFVYIMPLPLVMRTQTKNK